ncbi:hypothetical protein HDU76_010930, partial [Blyttiomyces sp. JEL0837]
MGAKASKTLSVPANQQPEAENDISSYTPTKQISPLVEQWKEANDTNAFDNIPSLPQEPLQNIHNSGLADVITNRAFY